MATLGKFEGTLDRIFVRLKNICPLFPRQPAPMAECHLEALAAYMPRPTEADDSPDPTAKGLTDLDTFNLYRDYMKHEDSLLASRLGSFLTVNTFLIAASVAILGGMLQVLSKGPSDSFISAMIIVLGTIVHTVIAYIGFTSAKLTASSIQAATDALRFLRDKGNYKLRHAILRGDLPFLTNGRGLSDGERSKIDQGSGFMRELPFIMERMWWFVGLLPIPIIIVVALGLFRLAVWQPLPS